jgi:hypothetical protein
MDKRREKRNWVGRDSKCTVDMAWCKFSLEDHGIRVLS